MRTIRIGKSFATVTMPDTANPDQDAVNPEPEIDQALLQPIPFLPRNALKKVLDQLILHNGRVQLALTL